MFTKCMEIWTGRKEYKQGFVDIQFYLPVTKGMKEVFRITEEDGIESKSNYTESSHIVSNSLHCEKIQGKNETE